LTIITQQLPPEAQGLNITVNSELQGGLEANNQSTWERIGEVHSLELSTQLETVGPTVQYDISSEDRDNYGEFRMQITTGTSEPVGLRMRLLQLAEIAHYEVIIAAIILVGMYVLIIFELVHRTIAALLGSFVAIAFLSVLRERPSMEMVISWIDFDTIGLLFGMMLMVGIFSETGFFEWSAVKAYKLARGNLWYLTVILCVFTAIISAFLDNVTTILLLTPVTIQLCRVIDIAPEPILLAEIMYSNIGGTATAVG
jgi:di/tricarboxylate transporter